jgi:drug/metabolite transporter (DMT)-like permease
MFSIKRLGVLSASGSRLGAQTTNSRSAHARRTPAQRAASVIIACAAPFTFAASSTVPAGYAALVRQVGPSVVTVLAWTMHEGSGFRHHGSEYRDVAA